MRYEILKFLSTSYNYKDLGSFIKEKYEDIDLKELLFILKEMYNGPQARESNILEIEGRDWVLLGKDFIELDKFGKCEVIMKDRMGYKGQKILSEGVGDLDNCKIFARITDLGRKELQAHELNESVKTVNDSVRITNRFVIWLTVLAVIFTGGSFLNDIGCIKKKEDKPAEQQLKQQKLILQPQSK